MALLHETLNYVHSIKWVAELDQLPVAKASALLGIAKGQACSVKIVQELAIIEVDNSEVNVVNIYLLCS